ncbi:MAG: redoxin domain-containing protein [Candidatus Hydrogenedentes bacterium]|nr:redoxin domain-containing protein [Candidatus Hydrogenedentota bacterium]
MRKKIRIAAFVVAVSVVGGVVSMMAASLASGAEDEAGKPRLKPGQDMPPFVLNDYEGKEVSLAKLKGKVVVVAFTSQECPYSRGAEPVLARLALAYKDKGVVVVSIDSHKDTRPEQIKEYALGKNPTEKKLPYPIVKDSGNRYADAVGARQTPEIYVVDAKGKLVYHGGLDNQKKPDDAEYVAYTAEALDEVLAGEPVSRPETKAYGCTIKRVPAAG